MESNAYLGELSAGIVYLLAGIRLTLLGMRTNEMPERFLGASFAMIGVSGILYCLPEFEPFRALTTPSYFAARVIYLPGTMLIALFTAHVFRCDALWAKWLIAGIIASVVAGVVGSAARGDWEGLSLSSGWFWLEWVGYTLPFGWASAEAFGHYQQARRRVAIGLCPPSVCNRMLLWSLFGGIQVMGCLAVIGQYAAYERENTFSATWDFLYGGTTLAALLVMWLAFFPPTPYRRWVERASPPAA